MEKRNMQRVAALLISACLMAACSGKADPSATVAQIGQQQDKQSLVKQKAHTVTNKKSARKGAKEKIGNPDDRHHALGYKSFAKSLLGEIDQLLPDNRAAQEVASDFEIETRGGDIRIYPVSGSSSAHDKFGFYIYDPDKPDSMLVKVTLINDVHGLGDNVKTVALQPDGTATEANYDFQPGRSTQYDSIVAKGYSISVPAGYRVGFWVNSETFYQGGGEYYSDTKRNSDGKCHTALATASDGSRFFGIEDQSGGDYDCNDLLFYIDLTDNNLVRP